MTDRKQEKLKRLVNGYSHGTRGFLYPKKLADEDIEMFRQKFREKYTGPGKKPSIWRRLWRWLKL